MSAFATAIETGPIFFRLGILPATIHRMSDLTKFSLPLLGSIETSAPAWEGMRLVDSLQLPADAAIPFEPQGDYGSASDPLHVPVIAGVASRPAELLAPAGGPEAAYAAFHFGADAIYLGLKKFSARAEAENFTLEEVDEVTAYAHSLSPRRRVFVTINTLIRQDELAELVDTLAALAGIGVDALIVQDLGVYHMARQHFPELELHASTQLAVHNRAGAEMLRRLGFARVVLARELTFEEVRDITSTAGIETEVFIHGALCYSYSGLCLFSSQSLGRSGNRGKCAYSCRDDFQVSGAPVTLRDGSQVKRDPQHGFPFSMKDLALPDHMPALQAAGVSCFKIEGRKKSPLYVATTTDYYRRLLDGRMPAEERPELEADLQTVFSRPWTRLFMQSAKDKEVADRDTVGHRGTLIGKVDAVVKAGRGDYRLRFRTDRPLERHDGLQIDLPTQGRPFGFAVDKLWEVDGQRRREVFSATAETLVEVGLPDEYPAIPNGAPVYCSSSQAVKQRYRYTRPRSGQFHRQQGFEVDIELSAAELCVAGTIAGTTIQRRLPGPFAPAHDPAAMQEAVSRAFNRLGDTTLQLERLSFHNDDQLFVPVSRLNQLRRDLVHDLEQAATSAGEKRSAAVKEQVLTFPNAALTPFCPPGREGRVRGQSQSPLDAFRWSIKVDRVGFLDALTDHDLVGLDEMIIDVTRDHPRVLQDQVHSWGERVGREKIRLALPALTRAWEEKNIRHKIDKLRDAGWHKWEVANLAGWEHLGMFAENRTPLDMATDWSVYVLNRLAARQLLSLGVTRFVLSPEDGLDNWRSLFAEFAAQAVLIVHQDTPLFMAESCAYANLIGGCPGKANCRFESMEMESSHGEKVTALDYHCRTIVLNQGALCLTPRWRELAAAGASSVRADFVYRKYEATQVRDVWRLLRNGSAVPGGHDANFKRGIL